MDNINVLRQIGKEHDRRSRRPVQAAATRCARCRAAWPIDYYLKQAADKVTIEILDAQGKVIKTFTGTPPQPADAAGAAAPPGDEGFRPPPPRVGRQAGAEPLRLGHALSGREGFPGTDHVGRQRARSGGASRDSTRCG